MVKLLLNTGKVNIDARDKIDETPLSQAIASGHEDVVKLLLNTGKVNVNATGKYGDTPLLRASKKGTELSSSYYSKRAMLILRREIMMAVRRC